MRLRMMVARAGVAATGLLFLYAGLTKSVNPGAFLFVLEEYQFNWPLSWIHLVAAVLPPGEMLLGAAVLAGLLWANRLYRAVTLGAAVALLAVFLAVLGWGLAHRDILGCGCFGGLGGRLSFWDVGRDVGFMAVAAAGFLACKERTPWG